MSSIASAAPALCALTQRSASRGTSIKNAQQKASSARTTFRTNAVATSPAPNENAKKTGTKPRALISVSDKDGMTDFAKALTEIGYEVVSTGGSARAIEGEGIAVTPVDNITNFPEMLDGRVKTLHPAVHGGILAKRNNDDHVAAIESHNIGTIDIVAVNLYPFRETVASGAGFDQCVENVDIGGPAMIRAAAKNHPFVYVVVDPADYAPLVEHLKSAGGDPNAAGGADLRKKLAWKAFQHCASYDSVVAEYLWDQIGEGEPAPELSVPMTLTAGLRYGENPHQPAAVYANASLAESDGTGVAAATQHHGKEMSYNNYLDADAAYGCACDYPEADPTCVIVKHTNPCGIASASGTGGDLLEAYRAAVRADPISAFGGIVAFNCEVDADMAREIREFRSPTDGETRMFYEIVVAPSYTPEGLEVLKGKSKTLRILEAGKRAPGMAGLRQVGGGWLRQADDSLVPEDMVFECVSETQATEDQLEALKFAWRAVKHVKSNAITVATKGRLLGMGSGQPNRVNSVRIALEKAGDEAEGSVLASDAFFPFAWGDSVEKACQAGVKAIAHPGGSMRDQDAVDCCNKYGVALYTTGHRHFRH